ncbi:immunoglobulin-like and fibronectin type III domain-containing protein 1 [Gopherus evgoodei]|uniref:immunoglobulin-like and fibronectin type III domain-containing protein 1 n=1 Tax=Gopherus evgoodei TaxID=1825980 RepID=UPI0011CEE9EE|nr:immunoglobulin-like and fibronectin type III domain-containing protein 1 [Gopherus evgoodei]
MESCRAVKPRKKSAIPGVTIKQFVEVIPKGCSTPDFERKPITLTLQEGKNAMFRAVVKGEPPPKVIWKRKKEEMNNPDKYQMSFNGITNEFILQINKLTAEDTDLYHCSAVNEYGEAACTAGLKVIQDLKKELQDYRKMLRKRTPLPAQKKEVDMEQIWQLLLNADRKDYEKICLKHGIVDFRGMLRKLQQMKKDREDKQQQYIYSVTNLKHIKVNKEGNATFHLEMDLKNPESRIYLYKDGQLINYGFNDDKVKHCLRQAGKKYNFTINHLQLEDAGVYQIKVEDVDVFSTELEADFIPVGFRHLLSEVHCHEQGNAIFECSLYSPCYDAVWLYRKQPIEENDKYKISISPDGLTHQLVIKNTQLTDKGTYTLDIRICSSSAWLEVEQSHCHFNKGLSDVSAQKGKPTVLSCSLNNDQVEETSFKDEFKPLTGLDEVSSEKYGLVHKLIDTVEDSHAGKYKFEAEGVKTEVSILVEDPPNVDKALLEKLMKEPVIVKAGQNAMVKIPFKGQKPVRATWLRDGDELLNDARIHIDKADSFTQLLISSTNRKDCGDYKVKLKNESGTLEASLKLEVIDKPQKSIGPIEVVDSSTTGITIQWKPPKDDGGTPVQNYIIEKQQVGRKTWVTLGETSKNNSTFTTNKVRQDKSYRFRVQAVNAEGKSKALESDEVMAATKAFPGPPVPPQIVSANKESITLSWKAPPKTGNSRILGYIVEKRKKGSNIWTSITDLPITDRKWMVTDLKEGLQYEFRVAAVSATGVGEASAPSDAVFARDPMKPPGRVRDLKVTNTDYTSIALAWMKPSSKEGGSAKGYRVEKRSSDSLQWTHCNTVPIGLTTCTVKGLQAREMYFLCVKAINEGGLGEALALDTCIQATPSIVNPKFLRDDTMKNLMIIKAGNCIRVHMPFEASPTPEVIWQKDGLPLPSRAIVSTRDGLSQLLIPSAEFSDSGLYTIILQNEWGKKESFSFQVQVTDIPQSPGPILLQEKILNTVTVIWEPSPTEKWESNLYYVVMKRDSNKGSWQVVGDLIYTNKFTITKLIPGRGYYFRVVAKNYMGTSDPSETVQPWIMQKEKDEFKVRLPKYRRVNQNMPPRFLVQLKPHVVTTAFDCHMSCAVSGYPKPKITWYKDGRNLSEDPTFFSTNDFGVCCLVIPGVTKRDEGEYKVEATNELGHAVSKAMLIIKDPSF